VDGPAAVHPPEARLVEGCVMQYAHHLDRMKDSWYWSGPEQYQRPDLDPEVKEEEE